MSVMEVSHRSKAFIRVAREGRERPARAAGHPVRLQGAVSAGRRHGPVRRHPAESGRQPDATRRLHQHRRLVEEGDRRGPALSARSTSRPTRPHPATARCRRRERCDSRRQRPMCTTRRTRPSAASNFPTCPQTGGVPLVADMSSTILSRPIDVEPLRPDLCGRAEEHRPGGTVRGDRARRSARPGARAARPAVWNYAAMADEARC